MSKLNKNRLEKQLGELETPIVYQQSIEDIEILLRDIKKDDFVDISSDIGIRLVNAIENHIAIVRSDINWKNEYFFKDTEIISFLSVLFRNFWIIILIGFIGGITAFFVINKQTQIFETQTTLVILPNNEAGAIPKPIEDINIALGTYIQVLKSRELADEVSLRLAETYSPDLSDDVIVEVRSIENSTIIVITTQATSPELAKSYADQMVQLISQENPLPIFDTAYPVKVLDTALLPLLPSLPAVEETITLATLGSLIVGILVAFLRDTYSRKP